MRSERERVAPSPGVHAGATASASEVGRATAIASELGRPERVCERAGGTVWVRL